jgi:AcrR family transcriptional regulator
MGAFEMSETARNNILKAASRCFSKGGFAETTMDQIANEARLSKGALYWYFKSKEELFTTLKAQNIAKVLQRLNELFASKGKFDSKLSEAFKLYSFPLAPDQRRAARLNMEFWATAPKIPRLNKILNDEYEKLHSFLKYIIQEAIEKGELSEKVDPESLTTILLATLDGLELHWAIFGRDFEWQKILAALFNLIINGLESKGRGG